MLPDKLTEDEALKMDQAKLKFPLGANPKLDELMVLVAVSAATESGNGYDLDVLKRHAEHAAGLWDTRHSPVTDDGLVERLAAIIRELDAHGDKDDAAAIRALLAAASDRDVLVGALREARTFINDLATTDTIVMMHTLQAQVAKIDAALPLAGEL